MIINFFCLLYMACFWDGLRKSLKININNSEFVCFLKENNKKTTNVTCQGNPLSTNELKENKEHINIYKKENISKGYDCSTSDPFLLLICEIYKVNIDHSFNGYLVKYKNICIDLNVNIHNFKSNKRHFWIC